MRRLRHKLGVTLALAATLGGLGGCYAGHGGYSGYDGYTAGSTRTSTASGACRASGGAEEFLFLAAIYGGLLVIAGIAELVDCITGGDCAWDG